MRSLNDNFRLISGALVRVIVPPVMRYEVAVDMFELCRTIWVGSKLLASTVSEKVSLRYSEVRLSVYCLSSGEVVSAVNDVTLLADLSGMGASRLPFIS